ncbi:Hypp694 [Branchiostoma lanceolatum]|uniref:Hypp694 protein n=1 Tax=Branchiostoma lanceolatum TaxID=7740 RepID=A0A8J9YQD2_BRALA|nr:Hypp694 [Branchiostoma lanceolatum]
MVFNSFPVVTESAVYVGGSRVERTADKIQEESVKQQLSYLVRDIWKSLKEACLNQTEKNGRQDVQTPRLIFSTDLD